MYGKLTIFVVCATVLQNSLAILSPTTSESQDLAMLDFSMLKIYQKIAVLQLEKVSLSISATERNGFLAKVCLEDCELLAEENLYTSRTCKNELRIPLIAAADAVLAGVHIADPETSTAVANARTISNNTQTELAEGVCSAIFLALGKNSTGVRAQIKIIADKQASGATTHIAGIFDAIRNGREDLNVEIELVIKRAQNKATTDFVAAVNSVFKGIETLASYGTGTETDSIISAIEMIHKRTSSGFKAVMNTKFELLQSLFAASCIIQLGITIIPSFYENATNSHLTTSENKNEPETVSGDCDIQTARETVVFQSQRGISAIFDTVKGELAKVQLSKQNVPEHYYKRKFVSSTNEDVAEDHIDDIERGRAKTFGAYKITLKAIFCTIPTTHPAANLEIQNAAISILRTGIDGVYMGIRTTQSNERNYTKILNQLQSIENTSTRNSIKLASVIYAGIREGQKCDAETEAIIDRAQKETINSNVVKIYQAIFSSFRTLVAERERCSETQAEGGDSSSSITADYDQASCEIYNYAQNVFDALDAVISTCDGQQAEIPNASCPATVY